MKQTLLLGLVAFLCSFPVQAAGFNNLELQEAQVRKSIVKNVEYFLDFEFEKKNRTFKAKTKIEAELLKTDMPLRIDLLASKVALFKINGVPVKEFSFADGHYEIPKELLTEKLSIEIHHEGIIQGQAIRMIQDRDGSSYIYTHFEPYMAHEVFPCFDQPDIKGIFKLTTTTPEDWVTVSNELIKSQSTKLQKKETHFNASSKMSTYLFFVGVGNFIEWNDKLGELPLRIFSTKSMSKFVDVENILNLTKDGLKFFGEYFGMDYPFSNYGQIFVPDFPGSGMEHPGAITLTDRFIFKDSPTEGELHKRSETILHEMAHMWFGDIVTMEWWNDLWLNESFASYMSNLAGVRMFNDEKDWMYLHNFKRWGISNDQYSTSHPIETAVPDTTTAAGGFDGITYAKGGASLKQFHFFVGEDVFKKGLQAYFKKYKFSNTTRLDFINSFAAFTQKDLSKWSSMWFETAGIHSVKVSPICKGNKLKKIEITQSKNLSGEFSPHKTKLALYIKENNQYILHKVMAVEYSTDKTVYPVVQDTPCPDYINSNYEDYDYAIYTLDSKSLENITDFYLHSQKLSELDQIQWWTSLETLLKEGAISPREYIIYALEGFKVIKNEDILGLLQGELRNRSPIFNLSYFRYLTSEERKEFSPKLESVLFNRYLNSTADSGLKKLFFKFYVTIAQSSFSQKRLFDFYKKGSIPGVALTQDVKWLILKTLARNDYPHVTKLIDGELKLDPSFSGDLEAFVAKGIIPKKENKDAVWKYLIDPDLKPYVMVKDASDVFFDPDHMLLGSKYIIPFFEHIKNLNWNHKKSYVDYYFHMFYPMNACNQVTLDLSKKYIQEASIMTEFSKKRWTEAQDELELCLKIRKSGKLTNR